MMCGSALQPWPVGSWQSIRDWLVPVPRRYVHCERNVRPMQKNTWLATPAIEPFRSLDFAKWPSAFEARPMLDARGALLILDAGTRLDLLADKNKDELCCCWQIWIGHLSLARLKSAPSSHLVLGVPSSHDRTSRHLRLEGLIRRSRRSWDHYDALSISYQTERSLSRHRSAGRPQSLASERATRQRWRFN